jgi:diguanylate cyclase (GGDEF)-like protein/PAS domain S-box-containing protein
MVALAGLRGTTAGWEWSVREDTVTWSDGLFEIFGLDPAAFEPTLTGYLEQVHPDDRARVIREMEAGVRARRPFMVEHRLAADDGAERLMRCMGEPITDPDSGEVVRVVGVCQDVSDRGAGERAAAASESRFRTAFENAPNGIALVDFADGPEGRLTAVNRALAELTGRTEDELKGSTFAGLARGEDAELDLPLRERLAAGEIERFSIEKRAELDDRVAWLNLSVSALPAAGSGSREWIAQVEDVSERKRLEEQLRYMADHDPLTGLINRRRLRAALEERIALQQRYGGEGALLLVDLDGLKEINDSRGHATGDAVLRRVAEVMTGRVRSTDVVARLAGDEFAILLPSATPAQASALGAELIALMAEEDVGGVTPSASIGVAPFGGDGRSADDVIARADVAMYRAKKLGGGVVEPSPALAAAPEPAAPAAPGIVVAHSLAQQVRAALEAGELTLYAQPAIDLETGEVAHRELLVRMREPSGAVVPASDFLAAAAQEPGLCAEIDRWVVEQALAWLADGYQGSHLHVNLSGETVNDGRSLTGFVETLRGAAERSPWLGLEIGEAAIRRNNVAASAAVRQLAAAGCSLVLDGFTGRAGSFEYLQRLPLDQVKIDGAVTRELKDEDGDHATLRAIVKLAQGTGKTTVAKLVESPALVPILRSHGVDMAQGFELGSPSPLGDD